MNGGPKLRIFLTDHTYRFLLFLFFLLAAVVVNPIGDFPLNDDFQYAHAVQELWRTGHFSLAHKISPNTFLQVYWGYLFSMVHGSVDYTVLRFSTLCTGFIAIHYIFSTLLLLSGDERSSFLFSLVFCFTPVFFLSSFSFMTEVPFIAAVSAALYYYLKFRQTTLERHRLLGFLSAIAALLVRQPGILLILLFEIWHISQLKSAKKWTSLGYLVGALILYGVIETYVKTSPDLQGYYESVGYEYLTVLWRTPLNFAYLQLKYNTYLLIMTGFYLLPLLPMLLTHLRNCKPRFKQWVLLGLLGSACISIILPVLHHSFPYNGSILKNYALGVHLLADYYWDHQSLPALPNLLTYAIGFLSIFSAITVCSVIWQKRHDPLIQWLVLIAFVYQLVMTVFSYTDRYILWPLLIFLLILSKIGIDLNRQRKLSISLLCLMMFISIAGTRDYLTWNRLVKNRYMEMVANGISVNVIDAGSPINVHFGKLEPGPVDSAEFTFAFTKKPGVVITDSLTFYRYLSLERDHVYIFGRKEIEHLP